MLLDGPMGAEQLLRGGKRTGLLEEKPKKDEPQLLEDHLLGYSVSGDASDSGSEPGDTALPKTKGKDLGLHKLLHYGGVESN